jgi:hypothetical protein
LIEIFADLQICGAGHRGGYLRTLKIPIYVGRQSLLQRGFIMPTLDQIMTRGGDKGQTSLVDGTRVSKASQRVKTYGTVDELNSVLGLVRCEELPAGIRDKLLQVQNELFNSRG